MILIFGGSYQGKLDFAQEQFNIRKQDCYDCLHTVDFSYPVLYNLDKYIFHLIENDICPTDFISNNLENFQDKIVILTDISCGVVPTDTVLRQWREEVGRCMVIFSKRSDEVYRVYCGLATKLK